jgi:SsrA-binding protein
MEYAVNRKVNFNYEILETLETGLVLSGAEVKSIKSGKVSLTGAYVKMLNGLPLLIGAVIPPYQVKNTPPDYDPQAMRKLLMSKKQIAGLIALSDSQGLTLVPLKLYDKKGVIKLLVGVAKGKKNYDKRESIKKKDIQRTKERGTFEE